MPICISVQKSLAEQVIKELKRNGLVDDNYEITRSGDFVIIPVASVYDKVEISIGIFNTFECNPPMRQTTKGINLPSLDVIGDVVILRERVMENWTRDELIDNIRRVYPRIRAIWIKEETVDYFRVPVLRLLWGEEIREVVVREHGISFKVRLGEVYYNPRLAEEHHRLSLMVKDGERVVDIFSGLGGFSLHIAVNRRALVVANDLNPVAYELIIENISLNKRKLKGCILPFNMDARELSTTLRRESADRLIADLPMWSLEYRDVYSELLKTGGILHLYRLSTSHIDLLDEIKEVFGGWKIIDCRLVLEYAPRTGIYRCDLIKG